MRLNKILGFVTVMAMVALMSAPAVSASVDVSIGSATDVDPDATTTVEIIAHNVTELGLFGIKLDYDTSVVSVTGVQNDPAIPDSFGISDVADDGSLSLVTSGLSKPSLTGAEVLLVTVTLKAVGDAGDECDLNITVVKLEQTDGTAIDATDVDGTFGIAGGSATPSVSIGSATDVDPDATTTVEIIAHNVTELGLFGIKLDYDTSVVSVTGVQNDPAIPDSFGISDVADDGSLSLVTSGLSKPSLTGAEVLLVTVTLKAVGDAGDECDLNITVVKLEQTDGTAIDATDVDGTFTISGGAEDIVITAVACDTPTTDSVNITWTTDEAGDSLVKYGTETGVYTDNESDTTMVTSHSITLAGLDANTTYYFVVNSTDSSDNSNESAEYSFKTAAAQEDLTPPVITDVVYDTPTTDSVNITWTTDEDGDSLVKYGTETGVYTDNESDTTMVTSHSITLAGLDANTTYYFVVNSTDSSDNSNESAEYSFTTATAQEDLTPPVITSVEIDPAVVGPNDPINVKVTATDAESDVASVTANNETLVLVNGTWEGAITAESAAGVYNVTVVATDAAGNVAEDDETTYTVTEPMPPVNLSIEDVTIRRGENKTVPITVFNVVNMSGCEINFTYDPTVVYVTDVARGDLNFSFEYNINNGSGWMRANALDVDGQSGDVTFAYVTLAAVGNKSDVSEMEFEYSRLLDTSFGEITHIRDNGTFSILPNVLPDVTNVSATPGTILYDNGRPRTPGTDTTSLSAYMTDVDGSIATVTINLSSIGGLSNQSMEHVSGDVWEVTTNATEVAINAPDFDHQLTITATDDDGGINDSVSIELTVLKRGDVNGDGLVDKMDADYISRYLAGLEPEASILVGDVIGDAGDPVGNGVVDLMDALYLAKYTKGMEEEP